MHRLLFGILAFACSVQSRLYDQARRRAYSGNGVSMEGHVILENGLLVTSGS
jgi:hypothetical protein